MKKFSIVAALAIAISGIFASCGNTPAKANLKNDVDTLSYAIGMAQTQGLKQYLLQMDIDTTYIDEFVKGLNDGANAGDNKKKAAYYMGVQIGQQISNRMVKGINHEIFGDDSTKTISLKNFMAGFIQGVHGKGIMTIEQANQVAQQKMMAIKSKYMEEKYGAAKKKGEEWMAANAKKEGVKTLPSGVQYKVIKEGNGEMPKDTSLVKVHYEASPSVRMERRDTPQRSIPRRFRGKMCPAHARAVPGRSSLAECRVLSTRRRSADPFQSPESARGHSRRTAHRRCSG